tara:strand:- start:1217 stop:1402 length:186 start_codon:yes stop_codon:yes gene_type:complete
MGIARKIGRVVAELTRRIFKQGVSNLLLHISTDTGNTLTVDSEIRGIVMAYISIRIHKEIS